VAVCLLEVLPFEEFDELGLELWCDDDIEVVVKRALNAEAA